MSSAFQDVKPWPAEKAAPTQAGIGHNRPPLDESIVGEFVEALTRDGIVARIGSLAKRGKGLQAVDNDEMAGRAGDFIAMCREVEKTVEAERERHNRPLLTAQRSLKAKADGLVADMNAAVQHVRSLTEGYMREKRRREDELRRQAEEAARQAREAAEAAQREAAAQGQPESVAPVVHVEPVKVETAPVRGDYGSKVGTTTVWRHEITSVRQLPNSFLKHPRVIVALDKVVAQAIRSGTREIKGVRIWDEQALSVR